MGPAAAKERTRAKGEETRARIVEHAFELASAVGLTGLTIGELSDALGLSKSGLFAHFGSKENLQLEVLDHAAAHFTSRVFTPALKVPRGRPRLVSVFHHWLRWVHSKELAGGCVFLAAAAEWDDREGPVRSRLVEWFKALNQGLTRATQLAVSEGHFRCDLDAAQFASEWHGIVMKYHLEARLLKSPHAAKNAEAAFERLLKDADAAAP